MSQEFEAEPQPPDEVELLSDGEILLVVGDDKRAVEAFLRSHALLANARAIGSRQLAPMLRSASEVTASIAEKVAESGLWVKLTPESAAAIAEYGLTDTGVPGVAHAMAGYRGNIKKWLQIDTRVHAKLSNPEMLSGVAGALSRAARQREAEQLRTLLEGLDQKLDQVLRGQRDEILGDLAGIERHLRASRVALEVQGEIDEQEWDKLAGVPLAIRQVQSKAVLKLGGIADELDTHKRVGDLSSRLPQAKREVQLWLGTIARCIAALDDYAALELERAALIEPAKLDSKRQAIAQDRADAMAELNEGVGQLMSRLSEIAERANGNVILNGAKVPNVLHAIEGTRIAIKNLYDVLGREIGWDPVTPEQWLTAIRQVRQWKNAFTEGGAVAWENGRPLIGTVVAASVSFVIQAKKGGKPQA